MTGRALVAPIERAWLSAGRTGARNYDEFPDPAEVTAIIAANGASMLAVDLPHLTPEAVSAGASFHDELPAAATRLAQLKADGELTEARNVLLAGTVTDPDGHVGRTVVGMVATDEISDQVGVPGRVIRNEEVFADHVAERRAHTDALGHLVSAVLLVTSATGEALADAVDAAIDGQQPVIVDTDQDGRIRRLYSVAQGPARDRLLQILDTETLIVADGNHRSLAAQLLRLDRFLAVITTPRSLQLLPYNRLIADLGMSTDELLASLRANGAQVVEGPATPAPGRVALILRDGEAAVALPGADGSVVDRMDHTKVERILINAILGRAADDPTIRYIGGDRDEAYLRGEVDSGRADLAVLIAPVSIDDFVQVNLERRVMPRKSTWFMPKARAGLVVVDLADTLP